MKMKAYFKANAMKKFIPFSPDNKKLKMVCDPTIFCPLKRICLILQNTPNSRRITIFQYEKFQLLSLFIV